MSEKSTADAPSDALRQSGALFSYEVNDAIIAAEMSDIWNGDIPYFWTETGGRDLFHRTKVVARDYFPSTIEDRLTIASRSLGRGDLVKQLKLIDTALMAK